MEPLPIFNKLVNKIEIASTYKFTDIEHLKRELKPLLDQSLHPIIERSLFQTDQEYQSHLDRLSQALHLLSDRINRDFPEENSYAARIQGIAQGILPPVREVPQIPQDTWGEIFSHMEREDFHYGDILRIDRYTKDKAAEQKKRWVEEQEISPKTYGCKTAKEAVQCIVDRHLSTAHLYDYGDLTADDLKTLIQQRPDLKSLILPPTLTQIPVEIGQLTQLEKLDLECGTFTQLPPEIGALPKLKWLNLSFCKKLTTLSPAIGRLTTLEHLNLGMCESLGHLPAELANLQNLKMLFLGGCDFLIGTPLVFQFKSLESLYLDLLRIPAEIQNLRNLKQLTVFHLDNPLPDEIGSLAKLEELRLNSCYIRSLPHTIGQLQQLKTFIIKPSTSNSIQLPPEIGQLKNLQKFDCEGQGRLSQPVLNKLKKLKEVRIAASGLTDFQSRLKVADSLAQAIPALINRSFNWFLEEDKPPLLEQNLAQNEVQALHEISKANLSEMSHPELVQAAKLVIDKLEIGLDGIPEELEETVSAVERWIEELEKPL